jgi:hypothetical protein
MVVWAPRSRAKAVRALGLGAHANAEHGGEVERVRASGERLVELPVDAELEGYPRSLADAPIYPLTCAWTVRGWQLTSF